MKKIPTLFVREFPEADRWCLTRAVTPGCEWVLDGEGTATQKWDGTCTRFGEAIWWARREVKPGKAEPANWVEVDADPVTGKRVGWEPIEQSPYAKAFRTVPDLPTVPGTYEFVGPKVQGNPHGLDEHALMPHGAALFPLAEELLTFDGLRERLTASPAKGEPGWFEGIVWHHPDGRMAKLKGRDFQ